MYKLYAVAKFHDRTGCLPTQRLLSCLDIRILLLYNMHKKPQPLKPKESCFTVPACFTDITDFTDVSCMSTPRQKNKHIIIIFALRIAVRKKKWYEVNFYFSYASDSFAFAPASNTISFRLRLQIHCFLIFSFVLLYIRSFYSIPSPTLGFEYIFQWEPASYGFHPLPPWATVFFITFFL